jgi:hypothetical protein
MYKRAHPCGCPSRCYERRAIAPEGAHPCGAPRPPVWSHLRAGVAGDANSIAEGRQSAARGTSADAPRKPLAPTADYHRAGSQWRSRAVRYSVRVAGGLRICVGCRAGPREPRGGCWSSRSGTRAGVPQCGRMVARSGWRATAQGEAGLRDRSSALRAPPRRRSAARRRQEPRRDRWPRPERRCHLLARAADASPARPGPRAEDPRDLIARQRVDRRPPRRQRRSRPYNPPPAELRSLSSRSTESPANAAAAGGRGAGGGRSWRDRSTRPGTTCAGCRCGRVGRLCQPGRR